MGLLKNSTEVPESLSLSRAEPHGEQLPQPPGQAGEAGSGAATRPWSQGRPEPRPLLSTAPVAATGSCCSCKDCFLMNPELVGNKPSRLLLHRPLAQVAVPTMGILRRNHGSAFLLPALSAERGRLSPATQRSTNAPVI